MTFTIAVASEAERNIVAAFESIAGDAPGIAAAWLQGVDAAIQSLATFPARCPVAYEQPNFPRQNLRQLLYKSHRIIFEIDQTQAAVRVLYVRHAKMRPVRDPTPPDE